MEGREVVLIQTCPGDWCVEFEASMGAVEVVVMKPGVELFGSFI